MATLTDEILDLHDRFIGSLFNKAKRKHDDAFQASGKAINEKVRLYARIGQVLLAAKRDGDDPFAAIEQILPWEDFAQSVSEAERLARPEDFDFLGLITDGYSQVHRYAPTLWRPKNGCRDVLNVSWSGLACSSFSDLEP